MTASLGTAVLKIRKRAVYMSKFTSKAENVLNKSLVLAKELGHTYIGSEHMLLALTSEADSVANKILDGRSVNFDAVKNCLMERIGVGEPTALTSKDMTPRTKRIIEASAESAAKYGQSFIGTEHILLALCSEADSAALRILGSLGTSATDVKSDTVRFLEELESMAEHSRASKRQNLNNATNLMAYGRDLTALASSGKLDMVIGRDGETERVIQILSRRTKNNPCLVGEPGVGKTAVVEGLAARIADGSVPETLLGKTIISLDLTAMIAGAKYRGEFEERMRNLLEEIKKNPSVVLFIDEIHTLIGAGAAEGAVDAANILKPALARGEIRLIGATTTTEYKKHIEKDAALERRFAAVTVGEPTEEETVMILKGLRPRYEEHHKIKITDEAIDAAVKMSSRYIGDRFLPDKAIDLMDEAASALRLLGSTSRASGEDTKATLTSLRKEKEAAIIKGDLSKASDIRDREKILSAQLESEKAKKQASANHNMPTLTQEHIAGIVTAWTGIPVERLENDESSRLSQLESLMKERIIGQDAAVESVSRAIRRGRVGLRDPERPICSFIFLGPTGVGKTELCRVLAQILFGDKNSMIRFDMSEFMDRHSTSKLIGSPPGYVGYGEGGQLTEKVRRKPYSVVLFDEIEKAHPDVFNLLLQILEDGRLTDSEGRRVDFRNTVIIMTSNVGAQKLTMKARPLGFSPSTQNDPGTEVMTSLRETFRPEFLNRVDEIILFNSLSEDSIKKITEQMLGRVKNTAHDLGIEVSFSPETVSDIAAEGFDPTYGARPIRRVIKTKIEDKLASFLLENGDTPIGCTVIFEKGENGEIVCRKKDSQIPKTN